MVNETFAKRFLPGQQPIGQRLQLGSDDKETQEIIGVVADVKNDDLDETVDPTVLPALRAKPESNDESGYSRHAGPDPLVSAVRSEVRALDPALPVSNVKPVSQMIDERISPKRLMTYVLAVFAFALCCWPRSESTA